VEASNSCARTLIFGSFLLLTFVKFFSLPIFRFFDLLFYCLFSFFLFGFLSSFVFLFFFTLILYLFFFLLMWLLVGWSVYHQSQIVFLEKKCQIVFLAYMNTKRLCEYIELLIFWGLFSYMKIIILSMPMTI
jgi:hypothetical protein